MTPYRLLQRLSLRLNQHRLRQRRLLSAQGGFTLTELLVVVIISSIIVTTLLSLVVQLVGTEQQESAKTETQRSMQLALNYIASDLRQAVYIYDNAANPQDAASTPSYLRYLPAALQNKENYRPVLAFWKPEPLDMDPTSTKLPAYDDCEATYPTLALDNECRNLRRQRQAYSLVAYFLIPNTVGNPDDKWKGEARIARYELPKYSSLDDTAATALTRTPGFVDPAELGAGSFRSWPYSGETNCQAAACGDAPARGTPGNAGLSVLLDFVDAPGNDRAGEPQSCENLGAAGTYDRIPPALPVNESSNSFFVCLRNVAGNVGQSQDVVVYLRGNAKGKGGISKDSFLPTLQTRITMRGLIDRNITPATTTP